MRHWFSTIAAVLPLVVAAACSPDRAFECLTDSNCDLEAGGRCLQACSERKFCAYPTTVDVCESGLRWTDESATRAGDGLAGRCVISEDTCELVADAAVDSAIDAAVDAPRAQAAFDVGYISRMNVASDFSISQWIRVVNVGDTPLDLSLGEATGISDLNAVVDVNWTASDIDLLPGRSGGALLLEEGQLIVNSGLVAEPAQDISVGYLDLRVTNMPVPGAWLVMVLEISLTIDNARANLQIGVASSGTDPGPFVLEALRASSSPVTE